MKVLRWCLWTVACALSTTVSLQAADTVQNFSAVFSGAGGNAVPLRIFDGTPADEFQPEIVESINGRALRLTEEANSLLTGVALNQLVSGTYSALEIGFDLSFSPGIGGGADGVGFVYANSSIHGATNAELFPAWGTSEEPNLAGSFGLGFDTFNNTDQGDNGENSVSLHFDSQRLESIPFDDPAFLESGNLLRANVIVTPVANGSNVTVAVTDTVTNEVAVPYDNFFVQDFNPYNGRPVFMARTGGANSEQVLDNVSLKLTPTAGAVQEALENFDSYPLGPIEAPTEPPLPPLVGGTPFEAFKGGSDPGVQLRNDSGDTPGAQPGHLQLTANVGSQVNSIAFNKTSDVADNIEATFKFRINDSGNNADGMTFMILGANEFGDSGALETGFSEEPNLAGAFGVGFDTFDNDEEGVLGDETGCGGGGACADRRANHFSLHWDGTQVGDFIQLDQAELDLVNGAWNDVSLLATPVEGGMNVTLAVTDGSDNSVHVIFADEFVAGMSFPGGARAAFGGRTGGAASQQMIDDVNIRWTGSGGNPYDYNNDGNLDVADIDLLRNAIISGAGEAKFDVNGDAAVNLDDLNQYVTSKPILNTYIGDANVDGQFNSGDLVTVFAAGEYEDATAGNSTWGEGDWNADGDFNTGDLIYAFQGGGYEAGPRAAVSAVPEPSSAALLALGSLMLIRRRRS